MREKVKPVNAVFVVFALALAALWHVRTEIAYNHIVQTSRFAVGGVSSDGHISDAEKELWFFIHTRDEARLVHLTRAKQAAPQLYGLLGLRSINSSAYRRVAQQLSQSKSKVSVQSGCCIREEDVSFIAQRIASGTYDNDFKYDREHLR